MEKLTSEEIVILGTAIALEFSKNKNPGDVITIYRLMNQICITLSSLIK